MEYSKFIESKAFVNDSKGIKVKDSDIADCLYDFQKDILQWSLRKGRSAIFADCGLGKTLLQLEWSKAIHQETGGDVLILAPLAVSMQTKIEGEKFGIDVNIAATQDDIAAGVNITNYEKLHNFNPDDFSGIVLDESSILKSFTGKVRTQIITSFERTPFKLACTATPAPNDFMELGNHAEFLGVMTRPEMLSMFFVHDGSDTSKWRLKGHAREKFWEWLSLWSVVIRHPGDLGYDGRLYDLPPLSIDIEYVEARVSEGFLLPMNVTDLADRRRSRKASLEDRVSRIVKLINNDKTSKHLVWCNYNDESALLKKTLDDAVEVKGSDTTTHKENSLIGFAGDDVRILVTKPSIAGFGMNWQNCHKVYFCGLSDSYEQYYQAVRRCWRFGQINPVELKVVVSECDEPVVDNVMRKEKDMETMQMSVIEHTKASIKKELRGMKRDEAIYKTSHTNSESGMWELFLGDCIETIKHIKSDSVHYSVFSPPFASLYTYSNSDRDMGNCKTRSDFYEHFRYLISELSRIVMPGRNISFHCMNLPTSKQSDGVIGLHDFRGEMIKLFVDAGWIYHSEVCIWKDPVTAMQRTKALGLLHRQIKKDSCMSRQGVPDYLVTMRNPGINNEPVTHTDESYPVSLWQEIASPIWMNIRQGNTLQKASARENDDERHICPLQLEVIERAVALWSNPGDVVFSPFAGIGSEGYQSILMDRRFIGIELKESYYTCACRNLEQAENKRDEGLLFGVNSEYLPSNELQQSDTCDTAATV